MDNLIIINNNKMITTSLAERIQEILQSAYVNKYVTAVELALKEGKKELALELAQEGIQHHESKALGTGDNGTLGFVVPLCELIGDYRRAQKYCEKLQMYEKGGDLAMKLGEQDEARRWWRRQIEYNESRDPELYYGENVFLAKEMSDENKAQEFYRRLIIKVDKIKCNSAWDAHIAEEMGDTKRAVRWYAAVGWLGNAARVAFQAGESYQWIIDRIVTNFEERGTLREVQGGGGFFTYKAVEIDTAEQIEANDRFWNQLLKTLITHYRDRNRYDVVKRLKAQQETFISPGKANVYLTLEKWLEEK